MLFPRQPIHCLLQIRLCRPGIPGRGVQVFVTGQHRYPVDTLSIVDQRLAERVAKMGSSPFAPLWCVL
jgi:hypothetical protein